MVLTCLFLVFEHGLLIRQMQSWLLECGWVYKPRIEYQEKYKDEMNIGETAIDFGGHVVGI